MVTPNTVTQVESHSSGAEAAASSPFFSPWRCEEEADVLETCASSRAETPNIVALSQYLASCSAHSGAEAATSSAFYSARIEGLRELRSKVDSRMEFDVESSISHWTELSAATDDSDDQVPNSVVFEKLKEHLEWGLFFQGKQYELEIKCLLNTKTFATLRSLCRMPNLCSLHIPFAIENIHNSCIRIKWRTFHSTPFQHLLIHELTQVTPMPLKYEWKSPIILKV